MRTNHWLVRGLLALASAGILVAFLCGCGLVPVPGGTIAKNPPLAWDVKNAIYVAEGLAGYQTTMIPSIKDTKRLSIDDKGKIKELWVVDRKGQAINYIVTFTPAGQGAWQFRVVPEEQPVETKP